MKTPTFVALDFETADNGRDSACAVGIVKVRGTRIVHEAAYLIRPPRQTFYFSHLHGITWEHVAKEPCFRSVWLRIRPILSDAEFLVAHNASFDSSVLGLLRGGPDPSARIGISLHDAAGAADLGDLSDTAARRVPAAEVAAGPSRPFVGCAGLRANRHPGYRGRRYSRIVLGCGWASAL